MTAAIRPPKLINQSRGPNARRAIYFCLDDRYTPYTLFLIAQIRKAYPKGDFDICLVSERPLTHHALMDQYDLRQVVIDLSDMAKFALLDPRLGLATYLRVFLPRLWANEYDRLLYLDADFYYQRGDLLRLFELPLGQYPLAAVLDCNQWKQPMRQGDDLRALGMGYFPYFNAGFLLIDVKTYVQMNVDQQVLHLIATRGKELQGHDQTALNAVLQGRWAELPIQWNYQLNHKYMIWSSQIDVCFFHFAGKRKPFYGQYGAYARRFTTPYQKFLSQHFPDLALDIRDGLGGATKFWALLFVTYSGLVNLKAALLIEGRASDDFDLRYPKPDTIGLRHD